MSDFLEKSPRIYPAERRPLLAAALLFFWVFFWLAVFRNYVDTSFIKRYGPPHIPLMLVLNGLISLVFFEICRRLGGRFSNRKMLAGFLFPFGLAQAGMFLLARSGADAAYPVLFQMLYLLDAFLLVYLWNLIQSLFDARQGKRLFRLLMGAQVLGNTLGSLAIRPLAAGLGFDAVLLVCGGANVVVALILAGVGPARPGRLPGPEARKTGPDSVFDALGKYPVLRFLVSCALIPSLLLPILTYQFGVVAETTFASEHDLLTFLSWFRAGTTLFAFVFILGLGRMFDRLSTRAAATVPPLNMCLVFAAVNGFFNIFTIAYGQFSFIVLQRAVLGPVTKQLFTLLPRDISAWAQLFVRGVLSQAGMLGGALMMLVLKPVLTPRQIGLPALALALVWGVEAFVFRRRYRVGLRQIMVYDGLDFDRFDEVAGGAEIKASSELVLTAEAYPEDVLTLMEAMDIPRMDPEEALGQLDAPDIRTRATAASTFALSRDFRAVNRLIGMLAEAEPARGAAVDALSRYGSELVPVLEQSLIGSPAAVQRGILETLRGARFRDVDTTPFLGHLLSGIYNGLEAARTIESLPAGPVGDLLATHLRQKSRQDLHLVFMTLWITHADMRLAFRALESMEVSAAVELLEVSLDPILASWVVPLVDSIPEEERIARGRRVFPLIRSAAPVRILGFLAGDADPVTRLLALTMLGETFAGPEAYPLAERRIDDGDPDARRAAIYCFDRCLHQEARMPALIELVQQLRGFAVLNGMGIRELRAVASITERSIHPPSVVLVGRGRPFVGIHLICRGTVVKRDEGGAILGEIGPGGFFGEVDLFDPRPALHEYVARDQVEELMIRAGHFMEVIRLYPLISLNLCHYFAGKLPRD